MSANIRNCQDQLAVILRDSGKDVDEAARLFKELIDHGVKEYGYRHPWNQLIAAKYARCLELKGSRVEALEIYKKVHPIISKKWGENDIDVKDVQSWIDGECKMDENKD